MVHETSYESGRKPFRPQLSRGTWTTQSDFIYASMGLALKIDTFSVVWPTMLHIGFYGIIPYLLCLAIYVVPIMVIQSFMGQFSSSGFISAFRIAPLFKGIGYISLAMNLLILMYYSLFAAVPLLYLFYSFRPTLPWSCEGFKLWSHNITDEEKINICNMTQPDIKNETAYDSYEYVNYQMPSVLFFKYHFGVIDLEYTESPPYYMSWELVLCNLLIWSLIACIFYKFYDTAKLGKLLRYGFWCTLTLLFIILIRFSFLPGAIEGAKNYFKFDLHDFVVGCASVPVFCVASFGMGWGSILSLASLNKFKTNIMRNSWIICLGQLLIFIAFGMADYLLERHFTKITSGNYYAIVEDHWTLYFTSGSAIVNMEFANMWSILLFSMLILAALMMMITQFFSIFLTIFDEFESLRFYKSQVIFGIIGSLAFCSIYFCSNHGFLYFSALSMDATFTRTGLNLLLILVVLWIYGRERFQRDIEFMLGQRFATWKVYMLRFVTPLVLLFTLFVSLSLAFFEHLYVSTAIHIFAVFFIIFPWLFIPGYAIFVMLQTSGSLKMRFKRCCRPTDWYPVDPEDRRRYDEAIVSTDTTNQLNEISEDMCQIYQK